MKKVLAVIPARGGSKRVPRKNVRNLAGKPLIAHTVLRANACDLITRCIVSTDDPEIAEAARSFGADVPFLRPAHLATDTAASVDVCMHAIAYLEHQRESYDYLILLQPTSPLRSAATLDGVIRLIMADAKASSAVTVTAVGNCQPRFIYGTPNRNGQDFEPLIRNNNMSVKQNNAVEYYYRNGAVYAVSMNYFKKNLRFSDDRSLVFIMPMRESINIDTEEDFFIAESIANNLRLNEGRAI
jgi:N-acylneuraminate cytidylyltransferase